MREPKKRFTPEFRAEAVRPAHTSGRSRREVAEELGIGLPTSRNGIDGQRGREMEVPPCKRREDMASELKRLRRGNEVLRQDREGLKRATAFFAKEIRGREVDEVSAHRRGEKRVPGCPDRLEQDFAGAHPNEKWAADISSVGTGEGWLSLAVVLDLHARRAVGCAVSDRLHKELVLSALQRSLVNREYSIKMIHHSNRFRQIH